MGLFSKGILLEQHKEPAFSSKLTTYTIPRPHYFSVAPTVSTNPSDIKREDIILVATKAGIYDELDGKLLASKLRRLVGKGTTLMVDAIDDEPYVSSKMSPLLQHTALVQAGIELCSRLLGSDRVEIQTYKNMGELHTTVPSRIAGYKVVRIPGGYPVLPSAMGQQKNQVMVGVGALVHLARAVIEHIPQTTAFITVAGNCVANPMNLEVSLGMNFSEILERCGLSQKPDFIVSGGAMRGHVVKHTDSTLVTPITRAVLALKSETSARIYACIGCGRCVRFCPANINPMYIYKYMEKHQYQQLENLNANLCIGCGTCSYVCASRLPLAEATSRARDYILEHNRYITTEEGEENGNN